MNMKFNPGLCKRDTLEHTGGESN